MNNDNLFAPGLEIKNMVRMHELKYYLRREIYIKIDYTKRYPVQIETFLKGHSHYRYSKLYFKRFRDGDIVKRMLEADEVLIFVESKKINVIRMYLQDCPLSNYVILPLNKYEDYISWERGLENGN